MRHVVIGGGIAGVCCVEELCRLRPDDSVTLISSSTVLKVHKNPFYLASMHALNAPQCAARQGAFVSRLLTLVCLSVCLYVFAGP